VCRSGFGGAVKGLLGRRGVGNGIFGIVVFGNGEGSVDGSTAGCCAALRLRKAFESSAEAGAEVLDITVIDTHKKCLLVRFLYNNPR
jgi:hypothetical protein